MSTPVRIWRAVVVASALAAVVALVGTAYTFYDGRSEQERIRTAQLNSCHQVGDPITHAIERLLEDQMAAAKRVNPKLFPNIPRAQFERLVHEQQSARLRILRRLRRVPSCERRFAH